MYPAFDIFRRDLDGRYIWCSAARTMTEANATLRLFANSESPESEFVILNQGTNERVTVKLSQARVTRGHLQKRRAASRAQARYAK